MPFGREWSGETDLPRPASTDSRGVALMAVSRRIDKDRPDAPMGVCGTSPQLERDIAPRHLERDIGPRHEASSRHSVRDWG